MLYLSMLIKEETKNGATNWKKVVIRYNTSYYNKVASASSSETKGYVAKLIGKNGALEVAHTSNVA